MNTTKRTLEAAISLTHQITEAKTATGGAFHFDGRILVPVLNGGTADD
jgi:hypothetical protein